MLEPASIKGYVRSWRHPERVNVNTLFDPYEPAVTTTSNDRRHTSLSNGSI